MSSFCLSLVCVVCQGLTLKVKWSLSHSAAKSFHLLFAFSTETTLDIIFLPIHKSAYRVKALDARKKEQGKKNLNEDAYCEP